MVSDTVINIRSCFADFFRKNDHVVIPSSSLLPVGDKSLLFVNSGMVQFKDVFLDSNTTLEKWIENNGKTSVIDQLNPGFQLEVCSNNAVTTQKCLRAGGKHNDLDNVGYTARHHTFFEMLGNFSFGGYFKEQAISLAWQFLTKEICLDKNRLYITFYHTDTEASDIWSKVTGFGSDRIIGVNTKDNFWSMGDFGPCGPCSEIYYDYGDSVASTKPSAEGFDGDRYVEIWNLVFMQLIKSADNDEMLPLSRKAIDTGMGLERITSVLECKTDNYDTSIFRPIIDSIIHIYALDSKSLAKFSVNIKVVADHIRAISFLIAGSSVDILGGDSLRPSNIGSGYVLRRILRRAMRYAQQMNHRVSLSALVDNLSAQMGSTYPELISHKEHIKLIIADEEAGFRTLLSNGETMLNTFLQDIQKDNSKISDSGKLAFTLYDTFGYPVDMTADALRRSGIELNIKQFDRLMSEQKSRSRELSHSISSNVISAKLPDNISLHRFHHPLLDVLGPCLYRDDGSVHHGSFIKGEKLYFWGINDNGVRDPLFYSVGGGQPGDIGRIQKNGLQVTSCEDLRYIAKERYLRNEVIHVNDGTVALVLNTRLIDGHILFETECIATCEEYSSLVFEPDLRRRWGFAIHHTATHLLHAAIRQVLGFSATQKGSQLYFDRLRFDFSYSKPLSTEQLVEIEDIVRSAIIANTMVCIDRISKQRADELGAISLFGEKYSDEVRVIFTKSPNNFSSNKPRHLSHLANNAVNSIELCGGTHVDYTGEVIAFKIISTSSIGSGIRRIEAVAGLSAYSLERHRDKILGDLCSELSVSTDVILPSFEDSVILTDVQSGTLSNIQQNKLLENVRSIKKELKSFKRDMDKIILQGIFDSIKTEKPSTGLSFVSVNTYVPSLSLIHSIIGKVRSIDIGDFGLAIFVSSDSDYEVVFVKTTSCSDDIHKNTVHHVMSHIAYTSVSDQDISRIFRINLTKGQVESLISSFC